MLARFDSESSKAYRLLLVLAVVFAIVLRITGMVDKRTINHDESISYLAATCHQGEYSNVVMEGLSPFGTWAKASDWKKLIQPEGLFCFEKIGLDLAHYDVHPPLYFWILHLWSVVFGVNSWTGPSLNIVIALATLYFLYRFAYNNLANSEEAVVVALTWALSPAAIAISLEARQYDLLTLIALIFVWQVMKCVELSRQFRLKDAATLSILAAAGALTHFNFSLLSMGCCIFLMAKLIKKNPGRLMAAFVGIGAGYLLFVFAHPKFYESIILLREYIRDPFTFLDFVDRMKRVGITLSDFFLPWHSLILISGFALLFLVIGAWVGLISFRQPGRLRHFLGVPGDKDLSVLFFFFWIYGITSMLYLAFLSPAHAMGPKYLSMAWPFFGFIPVFLLRSFGIKRHILTFLFCSGMLLSGSAGVLHTIYQNNSNQDWAELLTNSDRIIIDNNARGVLLPIVWQIPDDKIVFAATQDYLLDHQNMWIDQLDGTVYVSVVYYDSTLEHQQDIVSIINQSHQAILLLDEGGSWGVGRVFVIRPEGY